MIEKPANVESCPRCGTPKQGGRLGGLCPKCVAASLLVSPIEENGSKGRRFGDYELLEEIARGGMGVVFKARQGKLDRTVAVKMILDGRLANDEQVRRFRTEAESAGSLQHPNIVAIHEVGEHEGHHYFSMDYVDGQSLAEQVRTGPLPAKRAAEYVKSIAEAIHFAHERGILHRDLKPSNILIDSSNQPRITDFGLAKRLEEESDLTLTGQVIGTPGFISPEQASGKGGTVGPQTDVYSLGAILYFLVTGRAPFSSSSPQQTMMQVLTTEALSPRRLNPELPRDLETICLRCLEKDASRRYASARELADELGRFLRHEPIQARPLNAGEKIWRWGKRRPAIASLIMSILLTVTSLSVAIWLVAAARGFDQPAPIPVLSGSGASGVISNIIYQTSPCDGYSGQRNHFHSFDPKRNRWSRALPATPVPRANCVAGVIDGKFYLAAGAHETNLLTRTHVFDPKQNEWSEAEPIPTPRTYAASAVRDGKLFVFGGRGRSGETNCLTVVEAYDPAAKRWETVPPLPNPLLSAAAVETDGKIFVIGGVVSTQPVKIPENTLISYSREGTWSNHCPMPLPVWNVMVTAYKEKLYVFGGHSATGKVTVVQAYDISTDKWEMLAPLPEALADGPPANVVGGKIYLIGSWSARSGTPTDATFEYDPDKNRWRP
jgi:serine/threonine protein kinase